MEYILGEKEKECIFCLASSDEAPLTLYRGARSLVMMNKYPYINGHLLVAPIKHISTLAGLTVEEMGDLLNIVNQSIEVLKKVMKPDGFNVGLNLGTVAGAGIEPHLHFHIVPRWNGDINFMTVFAEVRVIPEHIQATYERLKPYFEGIKNVC